MTEDKCLFKFIGSSGLEFDEYVIDHGVMLSFWDDKNDNVLIGYKFEYNLCWCDFKILALKTPIETYSFLIKNYKIQVKNLIVQKTEKNNSTKITFLSTTHLSSHQLISYM